MDHLPHPQKENNVPLRVPFLPHQPDYDTSKPHDNFPKGHDYRSGAEFSDRTAVDIASFAQSFLYFGLLSDVLGHPVEPNTLVDEEAVSSKKLKDLILAYQRRQRDDKTSSTEEKKSWKHLDHLLWRAKVNLSDLERIRRPTAEPLPTVLLSIGVLIETLGSTCLKHSIKYIQAPTPLVRGDLGKSASARLLESMMKENGWCPAQIYQTLCSFPYCLSYFLSRIRRYPRPGKDHKSCSVERCVAFNTDPETYTAAHIGNCANCEVIEVTGDKAAKLVREGKIPLVCIKRDFNGRISLEAREVRYDDKYVAISHVWSDGMGNKTRNGLPICQLERISNYISELPWLPAGLTTLGSLIRQGKNSYFKPKFFWIDTLCIPLAKDLKKLAINTIPAVYAGATQVLVLDSEMEQVTLKDSHWPEVAGRLVFSAWAGRCWTLEEAGFSQHCRVRVADGCFDPQAATEHHDLFEIATTNPFLRRDMRRAVARSSWNALHDWLRPDDQRKLSRKFDRRLNRMICSPLEDFFSHMFARGWREDVYSEAELFMNQFLFTWNSLSGRQTSVEEDKLTIFIHMLDLNPFEVMGSPSARLPNSEKLADVDVEKVHSVGESSGSQQQEPPTHLKLERAMKRVLKSIDVLPLTLLYNHGPRAREDEDHDYRWLPLYPSTEQVDVASTMAWKDDGLHFEGQGYWLDKDGVVQGPSGEDIRLFRLDPLTANAYELILTSKSRSGQEEDEWRVKFLRPLNGKMTRDDFVSSALVFERSEIRGRELRGACLQVSKAYQDCSCPKDDDEFGLPLRHLNDCRKQELRLECTYDCPVRVQSCKEGEPEPGDVPRAHCRRRLSYEVTLKCG
jgi:hypothetical protein